MNSQSATSIIMKLIEENKNAYLLNNDNLVRCLEFQQKLYERVMKIHNDNENDDDKIKFGSKKPYKKT